uniref:Uncharacterized protein n=1 Tax=Anguilla anguilla TaxID=7936 RepID=A0A0E9RRT1_ANGAN
MSLAYLLLLPTKN